MDSDSLMSIVGGFVRHALTAAGGVLVTDGYLQSSELNAFVGGGMVIASVAWSWWQKDGQRKVIAALAKMKPVASPGASIKDAVKAGMAAAKAELKNGG